MGDFVDGGKNSNEVIALKRKHTVVMQNGGFTLHKWKSMIIHRQYCSLFLPTAD